MSQLSILAIDQFRLEEQSDEFYANSFSRHLQMHADKISSPHKHDFYLVVLITNGNGWHEIDFQRYDVQAGSVFLMAPGATHNWKLSDDVSGYIFFHSRSFIDLKFTGRKVDNLPFYFSVQNTPLVQLSIDDIPKFSYIFEEILAEYNGMELMKWQKIANLIDLLYINLSRIYLGESWMKKEKGSGYALKMRYLEQLVDKQFIQEKSPAGYAEQLHMSAKHLNRIVKSLVNKTVTDIITERVVLEAKRMLIHTDMPVSQLADSLGYEDYSYFSRIFKKRCGKTPKAFREEYQHLL